MELKIDLLLYFHGKQLRSCSQFLGKPPSGSLPVIDAHSFANDKLGFLEPLEKRKILQDRMCRMGGLSQPACMTWTPYYTWLASHTLPIPPIHTRGDDHSIYWCKGSENDSTLSTVTELSGHTFHPLTKLKLAKVTRFHFM